MKCGEGDIIIVDYRRCRRNADIMTASLPVLNT